MIGEQGIRPNYTGGTLPAFVGGAIVGDFTGFGATRIRYNVPDIVNVDGGKNKIVVQLRPPVDLGQGYEKIPERIKVFWRLEGATTWNNRIVEGFEAIIDSLPPEQSYEVEARMRGVFSESRPIATQNVTTTMDVVPETFNIQLDTTTGWSTTEADEQWTVDILSLIHI